MSPSIRVELAWKVADSVSRSRGSTTLLASAAILHWQLVQCTDQLLGQCLDACGLLMGTDGCRFAWDVRLGWRLYLYLLVLLACIARSALGFKVRRVVHTPDKHLLTLDSMFV